jgi:BASS family bile acid:Na+ symporter
MGATVISFLLRHVVFVQMLWIGLAVRPHDFAQIWREPFPYLRALSVALVGVPLWTMLMVSVFQLPPMPATLLLLVSVCPGAPLIPAAAKKKGESHSRFGLNVLVLLSVLACLTLPLWLAILARADVVAMEIAPGLVLSHVVKVVFVPLVLGLVIRRFAPLRVADALAGIARILFVIMLVVAIAVVLVLGVPVLLHVAARTILAAALIVIGSALMGYFAEWPHPDARRPAAIVAAFGNPGLVLAVVASSYPHVRAVALIAAYVIFRKLVLIPFDIWTKRSVSTSEKHATVV